VKKIITVLLLIVLSLSVNVGFSFECDKTEILRQAKPFYSYQNRKINDDCCLGLMLLSEQLLACNVHISQILPDSLYPSFRKTVLRIIDYCRKNDGMEDEAEKALRLML